MAHKFSAKLDYVISKNPPNFRHLTRNLTKKLTYNQDAFSLDQSILQSKLYKQLWPTLDQRSNAWRLKADHWAFDRRKPPFSPRQNSGKIRRKTRNFDGDDQKDDKTSKYGTNSVLNQLPRSQKIFKNLNLCLKILEFFINLWIILKFWKILNPFWQD